ncbi:hypothetical protein [Streptomyces sp. NPDC085665]|uniref:hypothetical protein n=1 Tax=Streptomyces sp. NPDC085665 TaxID=3365735 RepID=UPI0037D19EA6
MTITTEAASGSLVAALRLPVWNVLSQRAAALRVSLPPRPESPQGRWEWLRSLNPGQARQAALLDRLDALCDRLNDVPSPGDDPTVLLPAGALEEAEGFNPALTRMIAVYRAAVNPPAA